ncbi:MAG TPA: ATP-binding cassette domain-containing protein [Actinomycetota bacterium]|nr:ATP-binding cassette domain-containing protein [Actinomycetota bacterium]
MSAALEARGLTKTYRRGPEEVVALDDVSFSVSPGEVVALVGPSGSGKTTLLNVVSGWEHADEGTMLLGGGTYEPWKTPLPWASLAIVPQSLGLIDDLTIGENVMLPLRLGGGSPDRAGELMDRLDLTAVAERMPGGLSLGEQQRAAVARALVVSPALLLADEPTGHQDAEWLVRVVEALRGAAQEGSACLLATHSAEVLELVDRVLEMRDGRMAEGAGSASSV